MMLTSSSPTTSDPLFDSIGYEIVVVIVWCYSVCFYGYNNIFIIGLETENDKEVHID